MERWHPPTWGRLRRDCASCLCSSATRSVWMPAPRPPPPASRRPQLSLLPGVWGGPSAGAFSRCGAPSSLNGWGPTPPEAVHAPSICLCLGPRELKGAGWGGVLQAIIRLQVHPPPRVALPSSWGSSPGGWEGRSNSASDNIGLREEEQEEEARPAPALHPHVSGGAGGTGRGQAPSS